jgi:hypothetical protein
VFLLRSVTSRLGDQNVGLLMKLGQSRRVLAGSILILEDLDVECTKNVY